MGSAQWRKVVCILFLVVSPRMGNTDQNTAAVGIMNVLQSPWHNWRPYLQEKLAFFPGVLSFTRSHYKTIAALALVAGVSAYAWKKWREARPQPPPVEPPPRTSTAAVSFEQAPSTLLPSIASSASPPLDPKEIAQQLRNNFVQLLERLIQHINESIEIKRVVHKELHIDERRVVLETWKKIISPGEQLIYIETESAIKTLFTSLYQDIRKMAQVPDVKGLQKNLRKIGTFLKKCKKNISSLKFAFTQIQDWFERQVKESINPLIQQLGQEQHILLQSPVTVSSDISHFASAESPASLPTEPVPQLSEQQDARLALREKVRAQRVSLARNYRDLRHAFVKKINELKPSTVEEADQKDRLEMLYLLWDKWCVIFRNSNATMNRGSQIKRLISSDLRKAALELGGIIPVIKKLEQFLQNSIKAFTEKNAAIANGLQEIAAWLSKTMKTSIQPCFDAIDKLNFELKKLNS